MQPLVTPVLQSELAAKYSGGMSIQEIAKGLGRSYTFVRNALLASGTVLRSKEDGTREYIRVVRKKAGASNWYGKEKYLLSKLCLRIYAEQDEAKRLGKRGVFVECRTRGDLMNVLTGWYDGISGGER